MQTLQFPILYRHMATTILESFNKFKSNLEITSLQTSTVSTRQSYVRAAVAKELTVLSDFLTGSYSRSTLISPLSKADIDIFVVLDASYFHNYSQGKNGGQAALLDRLKKGLKKTYPKTPNISRNGQAVTITFSDFIVDVVPGFNRKGGGYLIPNSEQQSWLSTDPKKHVDLMSIANKAHGGSLVPVIKMLKSWNRNSGSFFHSFHLEVLALEVFKDIEIPNYPLGCKHFFDKARARVAFKNLDPAGFGDDVGAYINVEEAKKKLQLAFDRAEKAEASAGKGNVSDAVDYWRLIFGDKFPAYG